MMLNKYCVLGFIMVALAAWSFPVGIIIDGVIITGILYMKRKKFINRDERKEDGIGTASSDKMMKMILMAILADKLPEASRKELIGDDEKSRDDPKAKRVKNATRSKRRETVKSSSTGNLAFKKGFLY
ncbi:hypothetical protein GF325_00215 [Candidatus Bathyarchaeota archaeon]|nr:hypothetical protein [Candidatus Bathyarchaeota archaeon]